MTQISGRERRHKHLRKRIVGTKEHPRLVIRRSINNLSVQFVDDVEGKTILGMSSSSPEVLKTIIKNKGNVKQAELFGQIVAASALKKDISKVVFDRAGYLFHGRVKAFVEAARKGGLKF